MPKNKNFIKDLVFWADVLRAEQKTGDIEYSLRIIYQYGERLIVSGGDVSVDLRGMDLRRADMRGLDLRGAILDPGADLTGVKLDQADMRGLDLRGVKLPRSIVQAATDETTKFDAKQRKQMAVWAMDEMSQMAQMQQMPMQ